LLESVVTISGEYKLYYGSSENRVQHRLWYARTGFTAQYGSYGDNNGKFSFTMGKDFTNASNSDWSMDIGLLVFTKTYAGMSPVIINLRAQKVYRIKSKK
jgi:hypothetical protein